MSSVVVVTGAGRGLGLEFVRQYAAAGWTVLATARDPARAQALYEVSGAVRVLPLDVSEAESVSGLARQLAGRPIDVLINNSGIYGPTGQGQALGSLEYRAWEQVLAVNTLGPVRVTEALLESLKAGKQRKIVSVTSLMGSITDNNGGGSLFYRSSKAALNGAMKTLAIDLGREFCVAVLHPGWVRTDMGGPEAPLDVAASVAGMRRMIEGLGAEDSGRFFNYDGKALPW